MASVSVGYSRSKGLLTSRFSVGWIALGRMESCAVGNCVVGYLPVNCLPEGWCEELWGLMDWISEFGGDLGELAFGNLA